MDLKPKGDLIWGKSGPLYCSLYIELLTQGGGALRTPQTSPLATGLAAINML